MAKKKDKANDAKKKIVDGEEAISGHKGRVNNPTGKGGSGRKPIELTEEQLLSAIEGSYGRYASIAAKLGVSVNTLKKYIELNEVVSDAYDTEREIIVDTGEKVVIMAAKSPDPQVALSAANIILRSKRAMARGWNGGNNQLVSEIIERKETTSQDEGGRLIVLTKEKIMQIKSIIHQDDSSE